MYCTRRIGVVAQMFLLTCVVGAPTVARATPIPITINSSQTSVNVQLCLTVSGVTRCSNDASRVAGTSWVKLQPVLAPTQLTMYDFQFSLLDQIDLVLNYGVVIGRLEIHSRPPPENIVLTYPTPFEPLPPTALDGSGAYTYTDVPAQPTGIINYNTTNFVCLFMQAQGLPCMDSIDISQNGVQSATLGGTLTVDGNRVVTAIMMPNVSAPLDPKNPTLGALTITGTIRGTATLPLRGDADLNGIVDAGDIQAFVDILVSPDTATWQQRFAVDMNDDDVFDAADATSLAGCLVNGACPD